MLLIVALVLLLLLPSPWNVVGFGVCFVLFLGELGLWNQTVRRRRPQVGAETMIGTTATVVSACHPDGSVRLHGEIWEAHCEEGAAEGETVVVTGRDGLKLVVERAAPK